VTRVEALLEEIRSLSSQETAEFTMRLREAAVPQTPVLPLEERRARLKALAGSLSDEEADAMLAAIEHDFERVNGSSE